MKGTLIASGEVTQGGKVAKKEYTTLSAKGGQLGPTTEGNIWVTEFRCLTSHVGKRMEVSAHHLL